MRREDVTESSRMAGNVKRYHTWPTIQTQNNADHTWNVMRIYWTIFGDLSPNVTSHLIWHDAGEIVPGDVPHPVKRDNPVLGILHRELENTAVGLMIHPRTVVVLPSEYRIRCKICDLIEMHEFAWVELTMGNQFAEPVSEVTRSGLDVLVGKLESREHMHEVWEYLKKYCGSYWL